MKRSHYLVVLMLTCPIAAAILWQHLRRGPTEAVQVEALASTETMEPAEPIPVSEGLDPNKVKLGERLFNDTVLSGDGSVSCATCHNLATGGCDRIQYSVGIHGKVGTINAPTVFNSVGNFKQFWDGRAETLEEQIDGPLQSPVEMGSAWPEVVAKLSKSSSYSASFAALYPDGIQVKNIKNAIATFERSLSTPDSRFDLYLKGDKNALDREEKHGYEIFKSYGCVSCHQGTELGGNMFQTFGVMDDYFAHRGHISKADLGRFNVTGDQNDRYVFKVPSLRNVELTAPYFHDGSAATLEDAVQVMARYQLGRRLSPEDTTSLVKFLKTLTGRYKGRQL